MQALDQVVVDVTTADFDAEVIERSHETPVLVDFWAPWCGPCKMLGPVLEKLAVEYGGKFILAKANTEDHPELGSRYAVRSIPAVKLFHRGKVVGEFVGALPGTQVERFLKTHIPSEADELAASGLRNLEAGELATAREKLREATEIDPGHAAANLGLARVALAQREAALLLHHVEQVPASADEYDTAQRLAQAASFIAVCEEIGGIDQARAGLASDEGDLDARYALGCCLALDQQWESALEELLSAVQRNNKHRDGAAKKAMVAIFGIIGQKSDLADRYVRQLQIYG